MSLLLQEIKDNDEPDTGDEEQREIDVYENHIFFYSDIFPSSCMRLAKVLHETAIKQRYVKAAQGLKNTNPIHLHLHTYGGSIAAAFGCADQIKLSRVPIITIVEGCVASAGTIISMAGQERWMTRHSFMLIHQVQGFTWGDLDSIKDTVSYYDQLFNQLVTFYTDNSTMSEKDIRKLLERESWLDAPTCLKYGMVDKVL